MKISKIQAMEIIEERINQVAQATNTKELAQFENFAHGSEVTMWELGILTQAEHAVNYDSIVSAVEKRMEEIK